MARRFKKRNQIIAVTVVLLGILTAVLVASRQRTQHATIGVTEVWNGRTTTAIAATPPPLANPGQEAKGEPSSTNAASPTPAESGISRQRVFRLILEDGKCRLDAVEEVSGDFRPPRNRADVHAGMIACLLIGSNGNVLAEELVHAPDHVCAVLDPNVHDGGAPGERPFASVTELSSVERYLTINVPRKVKRADIEYLVDSSGDLST